MDKSNPLFAQLPPPSPLRFPRGGRYRCVECDNRSPAEKPMFGLNRQGHTFCLSCGELAHPELIVPDVDARPPTPAEEAQIAADLAAYYGHRIELVIEIGTATWLLGMLHATLRSRHFTRADTRGKVATFARRLAFAVGVTDALEQLAFAGFNPAADKPVGEPALDGDDQTEGIGHA